VAFSPVHPAGAGADAPYTRWLVTLLFTRAQTTQTNRPYISGMDNNTLLIIIVVVLLLGGGGFFFRGRR